MLWQVALSRVVEETIVVVNGSTDHTAEVARTCLGPRAAMPVRVLEHLEPLGHDVGRGVAAAEALEAGAEAFVFLDADLAVDARDIIPFARAVEGGVDVALNRLTPILPEGWCQGPTAWARLALNGFLGRPDLGLDGLSLVPHAFSRRALETVGPAALAVPPVALAKAVLAGLEVKAVHTANVVAANRPSPERPRSQPPAAMAELILGDHLEAIAFVAAERGPRGGFSDLGRRRALLGSHRATDPRQH